MLLVILALGIWGSLSKTRSSEVRSLQPEALCQGLRLLNSAGHIAAANTIFQRRSTGQTPILQLL